jgi:hypothetical protein
VIGLWKSLFWTERQMTDEFGPSPATIYRRELAGLSDADIIRHGDQIIADAEARARRATAGATR